MADALRTLNPMGRALVDDTWRKLIAIGVVLSGFTAPDAFCKDHLFFCVDPSGLQVEEPPAGWSGAGEANAKPDPRAVALAAEVTAVAAPGTNLNKAKMWRGSMKITVYMPQDLDKSDAAEFLKMVEEYFKTLKSISGISVAPIKINKSKYLEVKIISDHFDISHMDDEGWPGNKELYQAGWVAFRRSGVIDIKQPTSIGYFHIGFDGSRKIAGEEAALKKVLYGFMDEAIGFDTAYAVDNWLERRDQYISLFYRSGICPGDNSSLVNRKILKRLNAAER